MSISPNPLAKTLLIWWTVMNVKHRPKPKTQSNDLIMWYSTCMHINSNWHYMYVLHVIIKQFATDTLHNSAACKIYVCTQLPGVQGRVHPEGSDTLSSSQLLHPSEGGFCTPSILTIAASICSSRYFCVLQTQSVTGSICCPLNNLNPRRLESSYNKEILSVRT